MKRKLRIHKGVVLLPLLMLVQGCSSDFVRMSPLPPAKYEKLGRVEGEGCGALGIGGLTGNVIPLGINGRLKAAQQAALAKAPGATDLINVEISEQWAWAILLDSRCTKISGDAIREVK